MSGRGVPPEGPNRGGPDGEDEFSAVVFDATFVRAAGLHEPSARERLQGGRRPHRLRRVFGIPMQSLRGAVAATIVLAVIAAAGYLGAERASAPSPRTDGVAAVLQRVSLTPPVGWTPGPLPADPMAGSPAAGWAQGAAGIATGEHRSTGHFTAGQIGQALDLVREFVVDTQLDPAVLRGARPWSALPLLRRGGRDQLGAAPADPRDDDRSAPTGWVTRFDPETVRILDVPARVAGTLAVSELARDDLVVVADVVFVYAVAQIGGPGWTRFTVHRVWDFHVDADTLRAGLLQVRRVLTIAAPQRCASDTSAWFRPVFGADPQTDAPLPAEHADPYVSAAAGTCGRLASPP
jgi:hypothetical protein